MSQFALVCPILFRMCFYVYFLAKIHQKAVKRRSPGFSDALRVAFYVFHLIKRPLVAYICNVHLVALSKSQIRNLVASHHQIGAFEYKSDILESKNGGKGGLLTSSPIPPEDPMPPAPAPPPLAAAAFLCRRSSLLLRRMVSRMMVYVTMITTRGT